MQLGLLIRFHEDGTEVVLWPEKESSLVESTYGMTFDVIDDGLIRYHRHENTGK